MIGTPDSEVRGDNELLVNLNKSKLGDKAKELYTDLAKHFLSDFKVNLYKTSIELNETKKIGIDKWKKFLDHPIVSKYINGYREESLAANVGLGLEKGESSAISASKLIGANKGINSNILILRVPEKG